MLPRLSRALFQRKRGLVLPLTSRLRWRVLLIVIPTRSLWTRRYRPVRDTSRSSRRSRSSLANPSVKSSRLLLAYLRVLLKRRGRRVWRAKLFRRKPFVLTFTFRRLRSLPGNLVIPLVWLVRLLLVLRVRHTLKRVALLLTAIPIRVLKTAQNLTLKMVSTRTPRRRVNVALSGMMRRRAHTFSLARKRTRILMTLTLRDRFVVEKLAPLNDKLPRTEETSRRRAAPRVTLRLSAKTNDRQVLKLRKPVQLKMKRR